MATSRRSSPRASASTTRSPPCAALTAAWNGSRSRTTSSRRIASARSHNEILKDYPLPNQAGDALGLNNYLSTNQRGDDFYSINFRVDHVLADSQRFFVRYNRNNRVEYRGNWTGEINGIRPTGNYLYRINDALNLDHVWTMSPSTLLNVRGGWSRFQEPSIRQHQGIFDPKSLGFPTGTTQYFGDNLYFRASRWTTTRSPISATPSRAARPSRSTRSSPP